MTDTDQDIGINEDDPLFGNDTVRINDTVTDADGNAKDLSTANTVEFEIFTANLGGTSELKKTDSDSALTITGTDNNVAQVDLTATETDDLSPAKGVTYYTYRVRVEDSGGDWDTVTTGDFGVRAG